jgi:drug/metabolite transporter (DMT)-like permease
MNPTAAGLLALFIWGASALLITQLLRIPPLELTALTWFISFVMLSVYYACKRKPLMRHFHRPWRDYALMVGGMGGYTALFYIGFSLAPPFEANILNYLWPIFLMAFLIIFRGAPLTLMKVLGMLSGFAGCVLLSFAHGGPSFSGGFGIGHIIMIISAVFWALYSCFTRGQDYPVEFMVPVFLCCGILTAALHFMFEPSVIPSAYEWIFIFLIGACRLAYAAWDYAMRFGNQVLVTSASYFTPLLSTLVLIAGGYGAANGMIGISAVLIVAGCIIVNGDQFKRLLKS